MLLQMREMAESSNLVPLFKIWYLKKNKDCLVFFRTKGSVASCPLRPILLCYLKSEKNVWDEYQPHPHGAFFDKKMCIV